MTYAVQDPSGLRAEVLGASAILLGLVPDTGDPGSTRAVNAWLESAADALCAIAESLPAGSFPAGSSRARGLSGMDS